MRKRYARFGGALLAAALFLCLTAGTVRAESPVFEVAAYLLPPTSRLDESGNLGGDTVDLIKEILLLMGYVPKFRVLPFKRCLDAVQDGTVPMMLPCVASSERRNFMAFSVPIHYMQTALWKKGTDLSACWRTLDDLAGLSIGVIQGYNYGPEWQAALATGKFKVERVFGRDPNRTNFRMLQEGRVDMVLCDRDIGESLKRENAPLFDNVTACPGEIGEGIPLCAPVSLRYFKDHGLSPDGFLIRFNDLLHRLRPQNTP